MKGTGKAGRAKKPTFFKGVVLGAATSMLVLTASTAFATHAGVFTLGHTNTVDATSVLTGSASQLLHVKNTKSDTPSFAVHAEAQGPDPAMRVTNTGTGPGLGITVAPGVPPIRTFSTAKVNNLNVDLLDGQEAAAFLPATGKAVDADLLDGSDSSAFWRKAESVDAATLGGVAPTAFMRAPTVWKTVKTIGQRLPVEIGNPACSGDRDCTASLRCDPGDVLLSGGFNSIDNGTRIIAAFPFNANGYDHKYVFHWHNNSTADEIVIDILCANQ